MVGGDCEDGNKSAKFISINKGTSHACRTTAINYKYILVIFFFLHCEYCDGIS